MTEPRHLLDADAVQAFLDDIFPGARKFGARIEHLGGGAIRTRLPFSERFLRPGGTISGPTLMTLADTTAYFLVLSVVGPVAMAVTTHATFTFLRRPMPRDVIADAKLLKLGRLTVIDCLLSSDGEPDPVAHATVTYSVPDRPRSEPSP